MKVSDFKAFYRTGIMSEDDGDHRETVEHATMDEMRERGYVPVLGVGPYYTRQYDFSNHEMTFHLTIHGCYVGKERSREIEGVDVFTGQRLVKHMPKGKSSKSSTPAE